MSDGKKALDYAEQTLGVHQVWEDVQAATKELDELLADLDKAQDRKRQLNEDVADREVALASEMRGVHASMTDTRFKSEWKGWERTDKELTRLRAELNPILGEIQGLEYDIDLLRLKIKAGCARMEQLGGYLHFLAVVKNQAERSRNSQGEQNA